MRTTKIRNVLLAAALSAGGLVATTGAASAAVPARGGPGGFAAQCSLAADTSPNPNLAHAVCGAHLREMMGDSNVWFNLTGAEKSCLENFGVGIVGGILFGIFVEWTGGASLELAGTARTAIVGGAVNCIRGEI